VLVYGKITAKENNSKENNNKENNSKENNNKRRKNYCFFCFFSCHKKRGGVRGQRPVVAVKSYSKGKRSRYTRKHFII